MRPDVADLETVWFRTHDDEQRTCPHTAWGGHLRTCKRRDCPRCGRPWARSWESVIRQNLIHYGGEVALITITAPGAELLPWACERKHQHSGSKGCRVAEAAADRWAEQSKLMWPKLRDAARKATIRELERIYGEAQALKPNLMIRTWEPQKRGVPHVHVVVGIGSVPEKVAAQRFALELARLAPDYGFGFVDRKITPISAREAANYLAGYLLGRAGRKETIRENISHPRMPRSLVWLTPVLTSPSERFDKARAALGIRGATFATMRSLRYVRWYFAALQGRCAVYPRLRGEFLVRIATLVAHMEPKRARAPNEDDHARFQRHFSNLLAMRRIEVIA
jgi:hypothetical protein